MAVNKQKYTLTLNNVLNAIEAYKKSGSPIFRVQHRLTPNELAKLKMLDPLNMKECLLKGDAALKNKQNQCFSMGLALSSCKQLTQGMLLFFLLGGYSRFAEINADNRTHLFYGVRRAQGFAKMFAEDMLRWKAVPEVDKTWTIVDIEDIKDKRFPRDPLSLIQFIAMRNEAFIKEFCGSKSQEALGKILHDFAVRCYDEEQILDKDVVPMDLGIVKILREYLDLLARMAEVSQGRGKQPKYLAEGLTWLLAAGMLRDRFPADREAFYYAVENAHKAADEIGVCVTEDLNKEKSFGTSGINVIPANLNIIESTRELIANITSLIDVKVSEKATEMKDDYAMLRDYLAEVLRQKRRSHPSFQLLTVDEIDSELYPNIKEYEQIEPMGMVPEDSGSTKKDSCPIWEIIRDSWSAAEHHSVVITGDGGIGKTVALFSIANSPDEMLSVPALYIPMYELVDENGRVLGIDEYITAKYKAYSERIDNLATETWDESPRILILLDGFNEIPFSLRRSALYKINDWYGSHPGAQLVAVSRPMDGLNLDKELAGNPRLISLVPLKEHTIRAYLKKAGQKSPPAKSPIWDNLQYPLFLNLYIKTSRLKGSSPVGYPLRVMEADSGGTLIWSFLQRELLRYSKAEPGKAEDWVLRCAVANEYILPYLAYQMVSEQRMELARVQAVRWIDEVLEQFDSQKLPKHLAAIWEEYEDMHGSVPGKDLFSHQIWKDTVLRDSGILTPLVKQDNRVTSVVKSYVFMHQHFRDCLAGLYLVNEAEMAGENELPAVWTHGQNHLALDYAAELMDGKTADRLWEINRIKLQYNSHGYVKDHSGTYALLELQKRRRPLPKGLDFSGMDLCGLSMAQYVGQNADNLPLFHTSQHSLNTKLNRPTFQSEGHFYPVSCIFVLKDGRVVSGSWDKSLKIWDSLTGCCLKTLEGHTHWIKCVVAFPDGRIISGSDDYSLRVWDPTTGQCLKTLEGHTDTVLCVAVFNDGRVVSGSYDCSLKVWNPTTGQCLKTLEGHTHGIECIEVLKDGRVVSGSGDKSLKVWNPTTGQCLKTLEGHTNAVNCVAALDDGRIVSGSWDHSLKVWNHTTGKCLQTLNGHTNRIKCVAVLKDGRVVSGSLDKSLKVWDPFIGHCLQTLHVGACHREQRFPGPGGFHDQGRGDPALTRFAHLL